MSTKASAEYWCKEHDEPRDVPCCTACISGTVETLAREFYEVVMNATADQWVMWEHADQQTKAGYYDHAYEVAEKLREAS